jgi:molecular chaperone DnaK
VRETIDFGIDLGTTNSVIAVVEDDGARVIKNIDGWDYTPSAVWIPKEGVVYVGRRAREQTGGGRADAHAEFKQQMGVAGAERSFETVGLALSPEQLSAEVLKSLRQDAAHEFGAEPGAAVITVPASFTLNQNTATISAAQLAGLGEHCPLVQEPAAAAIAYGMQDTADAGPWMVFDLGGGTFDAAVMSKRDGELALIQHAGDPHLGGKLIDWALVDDLLVPAVECELGLADFARRNPRWRANFARLKLAAEEAKIQLSRRQSVELTEELDDGAGNLRPFAYTLTRDALDHIAQPYYARAVKLCRQALAESSLHADHIDRLLLVGGATLAPGLRELLRDADDGLGIPIDHSQDPTTVVARGAAAYAANVLQPRRPQPARPGEFTVDLQYPPQVLDTTDIAVSGKFATAGPMDFTSYAVRFSSTGDRVPFRGPAVTLDADGGFYTEVAIEQGARTHFTIELTDATGVRQKLAPQETFSIQHVSVIPPAGVLTHSLGFAKADGTFEPMLRRGATLPTEVTRTYRTTVALRRGDRDAVIPVPLLEGERSRADRNTPVGRLEIRPRGDARIDLPAQSEVEVTFMADEASREVTVIADVPLLEASWEAKINRSDLVPPDHEQLKDQLHDLEHRMAALRVRANEVGSEVARAQLDELSGEQALPHLGKEVEAAAVDTGAAETSNRRIRDLEAQLDCVEEALEIPQLRGELAKSLTLAQSLVDEVGRDEDREELQRLRGRVDTAGSPEALRHLGEQLKDFCAALLPRTASWEITRFHFLMDVRDRMTSRAQADRAIRDGQQVLAASPPDLGALSLVNERLRRLLPGEVDDIAPGIQ